MLLYTKTGQASEALRLERIDRGERDAFGDYDELLNRFATVYRDMDPGQRYGRGSTYYQRGRRWPSQRPVPRRSKPKWD